MFIYLFGTKMKRNKCKLNDSSTAFDKFLLLIFFLQFFCLFCFSSSNQALQTNLSRIIINYCRFGLIPLAKNLKRKKNGCQFRQATFCDSVAVAFESLKSRRLMTVKRHHKTSIFGGT